MNLMYSKLVRPYNHIQCLSHVEPFAAFFLSGKYEDEIILSNSLGCQGELAKTFAELQFTPNSKHLRSSGPQDVTLTTSKSSHGPREDA